MITREQKVEMFKMRMNGVSFEEIGNKYGISKQRVQQLLQTTIHKPRELSRKCVYPNLKKWCLEHDASFRQLALLAGITPTTIYAKLSGEVSFTQKQIDKILGVTGMTYEEAFAREENADAT